MTITNETSRKTAPKPTPPTTAATPAAATTGAATEGVEDIGGLTPKPTVAVITILKPIVTTTPVTTENLPIGMKLGAKGPDVVALQKELKERGANVNVTGVFDSATQVELKKLQKTLGLPRSGVVDAATFNALQIPAGQALADACAVAGNRASILATSAENEVTRRKEDDVKNDVGFCASGVYHALTDAGLAPGQAVPDAGQYGDKLATRTDIKEINGLSESDLRHLPPGAIIVYGRSETHTHGHIAVVTDEMFQGEAMEASDHLQRIHRIAEDPSYGSDFGNGATHGPRFRVFIPVDGEPQPQPQTPASSTSVTQ